MRYLFLLLWILCGIVAAGGFLAMGRHYFPGRKVEDYRQDLGVFLLLGFFGGPLTLVISFFFSGFFQYGWTLLPPKE